jgi:hypothetical protein
MAIVMTVRNPVDAMCVTSRKRRANTRAVAHFIRVIGVYRVINQPDGPHGRKTAMRAPRLSSQRCMTDKVM